MTLNLLTGIQRVDIALEEKFRIHFFVGAISCIRFYFTRAASVTASLA